MAETFYRIKGANGYYTTNDGWEPRAARAFAYVTLNVAKSDAVYARKHDPTARVVKTTLRRSKQAGPWCGNLRFDDYGDSKAHVFPRRRQWAYSICRNSHYWQDSKESFATEDEAKAAADAYLRKRGWVLA